MLELIMWLVILIAALAVLVKSSDFFTESAEKIGLIAGLSPFIVGVTIVAIGTSLPELVSSMIAVFSGASEIVAGNVVGSNIANIFLVLGIAAIAVKKIKINHDLISIDIPMFIGSAIMLVVALWDGKIVLFESITFVLGIILYMVYTASSRKKDKTKLEIKSDKKTILKNTGILILSGAFVFLGAKFTIDSVVNLSKMLGIGSEIIAITAVALGTSLPELSVSISAIRRKNTDMALGNLLGSNIFNAFAVTGIAGLFGTLIVPVSIITIGIPFMVGATLMYFFITMDKKVTKWEGWLLILFYAMFVAYMVASAL